MVKQRRDRLPRTYPTDHDSGLRNMSEVYFAMREKRLALFSAHYLPNIGGVEKYTYNLARELVGEGYDVTVVTTDASAPCGIEKGESGVEVVRLPCFPMVGGRMPIPRYNSEFRRLWGFLKSRSFTAVLVNARFYLHSLLGLQLAKRMGLRAVVCEHGSAYLTFGSTFLDKLVVAYEHAITGCVKLYTPDFYAVSRKGLEWLRTFSIRGKGVLSNAIDADAFLGSSSGRQFRKEMELDDDAVLAAFVGRFIPEKGIDALIEAMRMLDARDVPLTLAVAGAGPLEEDLNSSGLSNIVVLGRLDQSDVAALLIASDVLCLPTRSEGFATSLLEAAACKTPAIITNVGGVAEMIPNSSFGTVINDAQPCTIADALQWAFDNKAALVKQGSLCNARARELYLWRNTAEAVIHACENANR